MAQWQAAESLFSSSSEEKDTQSPEFKAWQRLKSQATNPLNFREWQSEEPIIDPRWEEFSAFLEDVGPKPHPAAVLRRHDNARPFSKGNVFWKVPTGQASLVTQDDSPADQSQESEESTLPVSITRQLLARSSGSEPQEKKKRGRQVSPERQKMIDLAVELRKQGMKLSLIEEKTGIHQAQLSQILKKFGLAKERKARLSHGPVKIITPAEIYDAKAGDVLTEPGSTAEPLNESLAASDTDVEGRGSEEALELSLTHEEITSGSATLDRAKPEPVVYMDQGASSGIKPSRGRKVAPEKRDAFINEYLKSRSILAASKKSGVSYSAAVKIAKTVALPELNIESSTAFANKLGSSSAKRTAPESTGVSPSAIDAENVKAASKKQGLAPTKVILVLRALGIEVRGEIRRGRPPKLKPLSSSKAAEKTSVISVSELKRTKPVIKIKRGRKSKAAASLKKEKGRLIDVKTLRRAPKKNAKRKPLDIKLIVALKKKGVPVSKIADRFGVSEVTIYAKLPKSLKRGK